MGISMKISNRIFGILSILMLIIFSPVLFCVVIMGNSMDYWDDMKIVTRLPNQVLFIIALAGLVICVFLFWKCRGFKLSVQMNWVTNSVLVLLFLILYFVNIRVAREIAFHLPWDIMVVKGAAYEIAFEQEMGYQYYFSMYHNNIPIAYILGRLYRKAMEMQNYPYINDFIWIQVNCALISIAGFFCCLTVKKLTKKLLPVVAVFFLYLVLAGISPWKIAPYTDTYGMIFPVMCIYFYVSYRKAGHIWSKIINILLSVAVGMAGGFIKPNLYIIVIALLGTECICLLTDFKKRWGFFLTEVVLIVAFIFGSKVYTNHIIEEIGLEYNEEIEAGLPHYFLMGLNEDSTGGYNQEDVALFGEFQTSKGDRERAEMQKAFERMKDRGFFGSIYFYLKKMVMTFNDGVFGWRTEVWIHEKYPASMASNTAFTEQLRSIFWISDAGYDVGGYNTLCQLVWIFAILGIPGICLLKAGEREELGILIISFLGVFFYQMLFEARARYLFVFLPILLVVVICGIQQYTDCLVLSFAKRKKRDDIIPKDNVISASNEEV